MNYRVFKNKKEASRAAYELFKSKLKTNSIIGLATGETPMNFYKELIDDQKISQVSYKDVITFNLDEYVGISYDHPESYHKFMDTNLFNHIDINKKNVNIPDASASDLQQAIDNYQEKLNNSVIDIQLLGIGANGHIGFNEPGTPFDIGVHVVDLTQETIEANSRFFGNDINKVPKQAVTMGINDIMKTKTIILLAFGEKKKEAIRALVDNLDVTNAIPCTVLKQHSDVHIFVDQEADYRN